MSREGTEIILIDNIGVVAEQSDAEDEIKNVTIIGVPRLDKYKACL